jgi:putative restriction endonuclease
VKLYLGVTDNNWHNYLSNKNPEDVNFWRPGGTTNFKALSPGEPFIFKLKGPMNAIAGIAFFTSYIALPIDIAWDAFGERNGFATFEEFRSVIMSFRTDKSNTNPIIGCIVLTNPIFFDKIDWIETPPDWAPSVQQGKGYYTEDIIGGRIWKQIENLLNRYLNIDANDEGKSQLILEETSSPAYGKSVLTKVRLGQSAFRMMVTDSYSKKCAITGERTLPVLEAAHIKSYAKSGPHFISNGLLLRSDMHKLFDKGYITITKDLKVEVSKKIKEEFENGKEYYQFHGKDLLHLPERIMDRPGREYIEWHNGIFRG